MKESIHFGLTTDFSLVIHQSPFEIEESGWGEFETQITIFFVNPNERPVCSLRILHR